jgi:tetratricopeptide (TPR) repeat protein
LCCLIGGAIVALACSDDPASDGVDPPGSKVGSAPPKLGELSTRQDERVIERNHHAREAFDRWAPLVTSGAREQARALCESWLREPDRGQHGEAHKCLANVEIAGSRTGVQGPGKDRKGVVGAPVSRAGVDAAVEHYAAAIAATPLDPDAHVGRVDILVVAGRYREANLALDQSLRMFSSRALLENWFKLLGRFHRSGALHQGLEYLKVIEKHHPLDHRVVSNLGAYYAMTGNSDEALAYSERAVAINPDDPIDKWNLARIYDHRGQLDDADRSYREALAVFGDTDPKARCDYVEFVATRLLDTERACAFARAQCDELYQKNCTDADGQSNEPDPAKG